MTLTHSVAREAAEPRGYAGISLRGRRSWRWMMLLIAHIGEPVTSIRSTRSMSARSTAVVSSAPSSDRRTRGRPARSRFGGRRHG